MTERVWSNHAESTAAMLGTDVDVELECSIDVRTSTFRTNVENAPFRTENYLENRISPHFHRKKIYVILVLFPENRQGYKQFENAIGESKIIRNYRALQLENLSHSKKINK